ncbi:aminodeoxychorismate synthase component I [Flagellatimonas centrodinii]|uniref:aminodeoxychorismate synthase component I n=1 Tax=Flagellatimonas centrodinii TaxID=2806210 RepID=UPI001FEEFA25|nr:aminodeoxychorismate synthase component I [Flagellatimonas centrodinii]ULQ46257.1 aminodeoxychorismate synthase component I [Flagellatimonas centrodinii]
MSFIAQASVDKDLFDLHSSQTSAFPFLLESVAGHPRSGRFDLLLGRPEQVIQAGDPFAALDAAARSTPPIPPHPLLPFLGGWLVFLGYEAARWVEPSVVFHPRPVGHADAWLARCCNAVLRDRRLGQVYAVSEHSLADAEALLAAALAAPAAQLQAPRMDTLAAEPPERYLDGVLRVHDYLMAGDVFQVNLSRAWQGRLADGANAMTVYAALRQHNPAPFAASLHGPGPAVISSSPERLLSLDASGAQTRPIAGTRPRGITDAEDALARASLAASLKERAEHIMLIDLERNDLGRVCQPGSVSVDELMAIESYAHVHHIVSNVRGRLRDGVGPGAALRAVFPGGTITGCPKVRCMEIIGELESGPRGAYTGSVGYLSRCGRFDSNILIRSLEITGRDLRFRVGAGIVADSTPEHELAETDAKARGLLRALQVGL